MTARLALAWLLLLNLASLCLPLPPLLRRLHRVRPAAILHTPSSAAKPGILINIEHLNVENPRDLRWASVLQKPQFVGQYSDWSVRCCAKQISRQRKTDRDPDPAF